MSRDGELTQYGELAQYGELTHLCVELEGNIGIGKTTLIRSLSCFTASPDKKREMDVKMDTKMDTKTTSISSTVAAVDLSTYSEPRTASSSSETTTSCRSPLMKKEESLKEDEVKCKVKQVKEEEEEEETEENGIEQTGIVRETILPIFLSAFYSNQRKFALSFQIYMQMQRRMAMNEATYFSKLNHGKPILLDRGAVGDTVFALVANKCTRMMDDESFNCYVEVCQRKQPDAHLVASVNVLIYLVALPSKCLERVNRRSRGMETGLTVEYLDQLDFIYFELLCQWIGQVATSENVITQMEEAQMEEETKLLCKWIGQVATSECVAGGGKEHTPIRLTTSSSNVTSVPPSIKVTTPISIPTSSSSSSSSSSASSSSSSASSASSYVAAASSSVVSSVSSVSSSAVSSVSSSSSSSVSSSAVSSTSSAVSSVSSSVSSSSSSSSSHGSNVISSLKSSSSSSSSSSSFVNPLMQKLNLGPPPKCLFVNWNEFQCTENVLQNVRDLYSGKLRTSKISFISTKEWNRFLLQKLVQGSRLPHLLDILQSVEDIKYHRINGKGKTVIGSGHLAVNWSLEHTTEFRHVVLNHLSYPGSHILFFNVEMDTEGHIVDRFSTWNSTVGSSTVVS